MLFGRPSDDVKAPSLNKFSLDDLPIITMSISSDKLNNKELYDFLEKKMNQFFLVSNGVAQVDLIGGQEREIQVNLDDKNYKVMDFLFEMLQKQFYLQT